MTTLRESLAAGYDCLAAAADLLDRINVFPVADGDTGTNLRVSLAPLRRLEKEGDDLARMLARCATGNSGNIAAAFLREFCRAENPAELADRAALGRTRAWQAVADPFPGTMLTVFDRLAEVLGGQDEEGIPYLPLSLGLQKAVHETATILPDLRKAGVVDSGALAMYVFFDGFFRHLTGETGTALSIFDLFAGKLAVSGSYSPEASDRHCVDLILQMRRPRGLEEDGRHQTGVRDDLARLGESVVVVEEDSLLKIHIHTPDPESLRERLGDLGEIVGWSKTAIDHGGAAAAAAGAGKSPIHLVTDAAGSLTRELARELGVTLLDSYIVAGDESRPESLFRPAEIYPRMRRGERITTAQASTFERHRHYETICRQFGRSLYLSVGSAFTGNYRTAAAWQKANDPEGLFTVIDTGAASGRLALIALLTARRASEAGSAEEVIDFAERMTEACREYVFINELKYLAAGGRVSKAGGFFGDLFAMKPIISPTREGVRKMGVVRSAQAQAAFAAARLKHEAGAAPTVLLQHSDNEDWVAGSMRQQVRSLLPEAEIILAPLSLTSGVHMGPGTWSLAFAPRP